MTHDSLRPSQGIDDKDGMSELYRRIGARPVDPERIAAFKRLMEQEVIPEIVRTVQQRQRDAAATRHDVISGAADWLYCAWTSEQAQHAAWRKRATEAEAELSSLLAEKGRLADALQEARERIRKIEQLARLEEMERVLGGMLSPASDIQRGLQLLEAIAVLRIDKKQAEAALQDAQPLDPPIFDSRDRARRILQSWVDAIAQAPEDDRFALSIVILRTAPGQDPEHFTIETTEP